MDKEKVELNQKKNIIRKKLHTAKHLIAGAVNIFEEIIDDTENMEENNE